MEKVQGFVENGNVTVTVGGLSATQKFMGNYPQAVVTVYGAGTLVLSTIYSDNSSTPKANPFTSSVTGYWFFYALNSRYDVTFSGGGLASPITFGDVLLADPFASGGAVTSFNGRTGAVTPASNDYSVAQLSGLPVTVAQGGTSAITLTGILEGHGTSAVTGNPAATELTYLRRKPNNGATAAYEFSALAYLVSTDYAFTAQTPGGSLSIGSNTITIAPVPLGVNGADAGHYLYISAGTGTAEAVLITGGTAVSGATTGTVIVTCANTHSGAWTIQSATSGIQEALVIGTSVWIPRGSWPVYAKTTINRGSSVYGDGPDTTTVALQGEIVGFGVNTPQVVSFSNFTIVSIVSGPTTATGIVLDAPSTATTSFITRMRFFNLAIGLDMPNGGVDSITDNYFLQMTVYGIRKQSIHTADNGGGRILNNIFTNFDVTMGTAAIYHTSGGATLISGNNIFGFQYGYYMNANVASGTSELQIYANIMDDCQVAAIFISGAQPYYLIQICDNKLTNFLPLLLSWIGIHTTNVANAHDVGCISGNLINGQNASNVGIQIDSGSSWAISNNTLTQMAIGIHIGTGSASMVSQQSMASITTPLEIATSTATCIFSATLTFAQLTAPGFVPAYGSVIYCSNGTRANPVAGGGTGCIAKYLNGVWIGN